jgi:hypothetical protein
MRVIGLVSYLEAAGNPRPSILSGCFGVQSKLSVIVFVEVACELSTKGQGKPLAAKGRRNSQNIGKGVR